VCRKPIESLGATPTVVRSLADLSAPLGLPSPGSETVTWLVTGELVTAVWPTVTVSVRIRLAAGAIGPGLVQVTTWPTLPQVQPALPETKPSPFGSVSVTVMVPVVELPPTLVTVIV